MPSALVTGGSGFIGSWLVQELENRHYQVDIFDLKAPNFISNASFWEGDIVKAPLPNKHYDVVFHCAGLLGTETLFDRIREAAEANIIGTINVLEWARADGSTAIVQPNLLGRWLNMYMITKHCAEDIGLMYDRELGVKFLSIRPTDVYGPRQRLNAKKAAPLFITQALENSTIPVYGDGSSWVNYIYVEDVANFMIDAYESGAHGEIIALAHPDGDMAILEFAQAIIRLANSRSAVEFLLMRRGQPGNVKKIEFDLSRAHEIIDMGSLTNLEDGLKKTINWYEMAMMD